MALDTGSDPRIPATIPAPSAPLGLWAAWRTARRNVLELIPEAAYREPYMSGGSRPGWIMISDPAGCEHVLKTRAANYPRSDITLRILSPREGDSLFTTDGAEWRWQHRAMTPMFQHRHLAGMAPIMTDAAEAAAARVATGAAAGGPVDVYPEMVAATADVICDAALSGREALDRDALAHGVTRFIEDVARISLLDLLGAPGWIPRPGRLFDRTGAAMDRKMDEIIAARIARGPGTPPDLLDLLIAARDPETGQEMSRIRLRNNLLAFIVAGHETTALALTWALYLLALDPAAQRRARDCAAGALGERAATAEDLPQLGYLKQVIEEAMRLYPPAGFMSRQAREADEIAGHPIKPGHTVILPVYAMHRHRMLWDAPDAFDPDRFSEEAKAARHRFAYLPFSAGPRICLGMHFAMMEAQIILATLLARFSFALPKGFEADPRMVFTLRPHGGMPLEVTRH